MHKPGFCNVTLDGDRSSNRKHAFVRLPCCVAEIWSICEIRMENYGEHVDRHTWIVWPLGVESWRSRRIAVLCLCLAEGAYLWEGSGKWWDLRDLGKALEDLPVDPPT